MSTATLSPLASLGHELDLSPGAFGRLRESNDLLDSAAALRARMAEEGYLFLRDYLDVNQVREARGEIVRRLADAGVIDPKQPLDDAVNLPGKNLPNSHTLARENAFLEKLLYSGRMMEFHEKFVGGPVRHFDYTWLRAVPGGGIGTYPHCDVVYMGRGTRRLCTAWTPLGDISTELGGLMILEGSHQKTDLLKNYLDRDVDTYCVNGPRAAEIESGKRTWQWDGRLAANPVTLRSRLGGRWLTTDYRAGDVLIFSVVTVHASLDNHTDRYRLSSDSRYQPATEPADDRWIGPNPVAHGVAGKRGLIC